MKIMGLIDDVATEKYWDAADLVSGKQWTTTLTDVDRRLLWHDAAQYRWNAADDIRQSLREFLLGNLRTMGFAHVRNLADVTTPGVQVPPGFTFLLRQIGRIVEQNGDGLLTQVLCDNGDNRGDGVSEVEYQSDTSDLLVLLCLQPAADGGGKTKLVHARTVVDLIRAERPDVLETLLTQDFCFDRRGRAGPQIIIRPIFTLLPDGAVDVYYHSRTVRETPFTYGPPLTMIQQEAIAVLDAVLKRPDTGYGLALHAGDLLVIRNSRVLHGRSPYVDAPGPLSRRILRIWMNTNEF